ncbi:hypothetical protein ACVIQW_004305 [Bradyrhizobium diazoefficiens]
MARRVEAGRTAAALRGRDARQPRPARRPYRTAEERRCARAIAQRTLRAEMARRGALGHPRRRALARLRHGAVGSGGERACERTAAPGERALRARRHGQDLRCAGAADRLALGRDAGRRLCQRARHAIQSAGCDFRLDRRRGDLAGDAARCRRQAVRSPDRASQPERRHAAEGRECRPAVAPDRRGQHPAGCVRHHGIPAQGRPRRPRRTARDRARWPASPAQRHRLRRRALADDLRRHRVEAARRLVPAAVRQQPDADVGVRRRDQAVPRRQRCRGPALRLQPCRLPAHEAARDLAGGRVGQPRRSARSCRRHLSFLAQLAAPACRRQRDRGAHLRPSRGLRRPRRLSGRGGRHHRTAQSRGAHRPHGAPRRAHRPAEPRIFPAAPEAGARPGRRKAGRRALHRSRPVQEHQRFLRASGGRPPVEGGRRAPDHRGPRRQSRSPARRRRVRRDPGGRRLAERGQRLRGPC